ncbi:InlB B-repeat-containing protein, partial [Candidatus Saccharibacteria bacterium]|nr:InlB B-repeat-containing protein [Candidatus Saccharibacteria bacterium]
VSNMPETQSEDSMAGSVTFTIPDTIPTRTNYAFASWNTEPDGSGTSYAPGDSYTIIADDGDKTSRTKTLYARWSQYTYTITYNCNSGSNCPSNQTIVTGDNPYTYTIPSTAPTRTDYNFTNYTGSDGNTYNPDDAISLSTPKTSVTLTANWESTCDTSYGCWTDSNGKVWTNTVVSSSTTWTNAAAVCTNLGASWHLPSVDEFVALLGVGRWESTSLEPYPTLKTKWGTGIYWSSNQSIANWAYCLNVNANEARMDDNRQETPNKVVCTK